MLIFLIGCVSKYPTWSKANNNQKKNGFFKPDDNFYNSLQYTNEMIESSDTIIKLRKQIKNNE
jgi:hypothetical protein